MARGERYESEKDPGPIRQLVPLGGGRYMTIPHPFAELHVERVHEGRVRGITRVETGKCSTCGWGRGDRNHFSNPDDAREPRPRDR